MNNVDTNFIKSFKELSYNFHSKELSALDLGCGDALNLSFLNTKKEFKRLVAVDEKDKIEQSDYSSGGMATHIELDYIEFKENTDALEFLNSTNEKFNVIILSYFLHLFEKPESKKIFDLCVKRLALNGIVYIYNANQNHDERGGMNKEELIEFIKPLSAIGALKEEKYHIEVFCSFPKLS